MTDAIDYKALLKKYMQLVLEEEGITFVREVGGWSNDVQFTALEEAALKNMDDEVCDD